MTKQRKAELLLVMCTGFWGVSYYLTDLCLAELPPLNLCAFRFLAAFAVLGVIFYKRLRHLSRATVKYGVLIGLSLVMTYIGATYGVLYTSISNAGFICALPVVVTPLLEWIFYRKTPGKKLGVALAICTAGMALMTLNGALRPAPGDLICLLCAVFYAVDLLLTERAVAEETVDPLALGVFQLLITGAVMLLLSLLFEQPRLPHSPLVWGSALFLGLVCSGVTFVVQSVQQQYTTASRVSLIFTLEPIFSAFVAFFLAGERMSGRGYIGAALMMFSLVLMEVDVKGLLKRNDNI